MCLHVTNIGSKRSAELGSVAASPGTAEAAQMLKRSRRTACSPHMQTHASALVGSHPSHRLQSQACNGPACPGTAPT